ncbi:peptidylprolyl isomerase [Erythrobacteraceae bacterium E2-1 Yellow Sea]|nr:peptidylprolyl isomerase [Erythrobacteraceae bacterium E2-1 Yellow Sea]
MKKLALALMLFAQPMLAQEPAPSPNEIVDQAKPEEWKRIAAEDLLVMTLAPVAEGKPREVVIQLMPAPFSQGWVDNVRLLALSGYYDGLAVIRVQDNYVTQWGDPAEEEADAKPLPDGLKVMEEGEYTVAYAPDIMAYLLTPNGKRSTVQSVEPLPPMVGTPTKFSDAYAHAVAFAGGFPVAAIFEIAKDSVNGKPVRRPKSIWPVHCYGMVGVARGMSPNTGDGSSIYTVIGHAPRHLDRNIALVGRVIEGMEHLSSLPRGKGPLGFYAEEEMNKRTPILSVKLASELQQIPQPAFEYLSTESETFAKYAAARANRRDPFFIHPANGADICNIPVPVRRVPSE